MQANTINDNVNESDQVQRLKHAWYFSSPGKLYDQCIELLVRNIEIILVRKMAAQDTDIIEEPIEVDPNACVTSKLSADKLRNRKENTYQNKSCRSMRLFKKPKLKYTIREHIGPLPSFICNSLLKSYQHFYVHQLSQLERAEYFQLKRISDPCSNQNEQAMSHHAMHLNSMGYTAKHQPKSELITYYDLLMAIVENKSNTGLSSVSYRSCIWQHSTLEMRLLDGAEAGKALALNRSKQQAHLSDADLRLIVRRKPTIEYLDVCPCNLSNRSVALINKYLNRNLKYLRFQNCCNWHSDENKPDIDSDDDVNPSTHPPAHDAISRDRWMTDNLNIVNNLIANTDEANNNILEQNHNEYLFREMNQLICNNQRVSYDDDSIENEYLEFDEDSVSDNKVVSKQNCQNVILKQAANEESDDDDEEFDAYLQEYIDMYADTQVNNNMEQMKFETKWEDILLSEEANAEGNITELATILNPTDNQPKQTDSNKRKHYHCYRNNRQRRFSKQQNEKKHLLDFYENQLRLIRAHSFTNNNCCKLFSLNNADTLRLQKKTHKIQKAIKLLRRINLQNNVTIQPSRSQEKINGSPKNSIKRSKDTKSLLKLMFLNQNTSPMKEALHVEQVSSEDNAADKDTPFKHEESQETKDTTDTTRNISLMEQIRQKAQCLRETKLIDKVSLTSSNFDDHNLSDFAEADPPPLVDETNHKITNNQNFSFKDSIHISSSISNSSSSSHSLSSIGSTSSIDQAKPSTNTTYKDQIDESGNSSERDSSDFGTLSSCSSPSSSSFSSLIISLSSLNTTTTSASSTSTFFSLNSSCPYAYNAQCSSSINTGMNMKTRRMLKQQRLLEKAASLSSSPINLLQAIAAKALNFKLKNSTGQVKDESAGVGVSGEECNDNGGEANASKKKMGPGVKKNLRNNKLIDKLSSRSLSTSKSKPISTADVTTTNTKLATKYNRLLKQYRFFKSTNIDYNESKSPKISQSPVEASLTTQTKDNKESSSSTDSNQNFADNFAYESNNMPKSRQSSRKIIKKCKRRKEDEVHEKELIGSGGDQDKHINQLLQPQNIPAHLFSAFKYWMSKRIDLLNNPTSGGVSENNQMEIEENILNEASRNKINGSLISVSSTSSTSNSESFNSINDTFSLNSNDKYFDPMNLKEFMDYEPMSRKSQSSLDKTKKKRPVATQDSKIRMTRRFGIETLNLSYLLHLSFRNLGADVLDVRVLNAMLANLKSLRLLDITNCCTGKLFESECNEFENSQMRKNRNAVARKFLLRHLEKNETMGILYGLLHLKPTLTSLIMADLTVNDIQANLPYIICLTSLKHLDISHCKEASSLNRYVNPSLHLAKLAHHLRNLTSLDISATNLSGPNLFNETEEIKYISEKLYEDFETHVKVRSVNIIKSSIAGLMFLNCEKLSFLGCFCCDHSVSSRQTLPAVRIASEECETHLYTSLQTYCERPLFLLDVLNHLFELYRDEAIQDKLLGGYLIMDTMNRHLDHARIQISGCASLFYVLKYWKEENVNVKHLPYFYLKRLIRTVINGMEEHIDDSAMRRNCVLIMCRLNLPDDVLFVSDRLIKILLKIFDDFVKSETKNSNNEGPEHFVLRTSMHLLNILACSVHGSNKSVVGALAIPTAMDLIKSKIKFSEADDILEVTWSFLWNITDETPKNCEIFLDDCGGMTAFMECIKFNKSEIIRNMMGLLGNVAEVSYLRNRLCKPDYIGTFRKLLFHKNDGIEIPYNSAGVLVHIMSNGCSVWTQNQCPIGLRDSVIKDIELAVDNWDIKSERNINYRSFEPIFRLIDEYENPICQRWSCWALANLTTVYPDIYCPLFQKEHGQIVLDKLMAWPEVTAATKRYAQIVLNNVGIYSKTTHNSFVRF